MNKLFLCFFCGLLFFGSFAQANSSAALRHSLLYTLRSVHGPTAQNSGRYVAELLGIQASELSRLTPEDQTELVMGLLARREPSELEAVAQNVFTIERTGEFPTVGEISPLATSAQDILRVDSTQTVVSLTRSFARQLGFEPSSRIHRALRVAIERQLASALGEGTGAITASQWADSGLRFADVSAEIAHLVLQGKIRLSDIVVGKVHMANGGFYGRGQWMVALQGTDSVSYSSTLGTVQGHQGPNLYLFSYMHRHFSLRGWISGDEGWTLSHFAIGRYAFSRIANEQAPQQVRIGFGDPITEMLNAPYDASPYFMARSDTEVGERLEDVIGFYTRWQQFFGADDEIDFLVDRLGRSRSLLQDLIQPTDEAGRSFSDEALGALVRITPEHLNSENILIGTQAVTNNRYLVVGNGADFWLAFGLRENSDLGQTVVVYSYVSDFTEGRVIHLNNGHQLLVQEHGVIHYDADGQIVATTD